MNAFDDTKTIPEETIRRKNGKFYACADIHGVYDVYAAICNRLAPGDKCICLGDCIDRGPDGYRIMKEMLDNPKFIYLKGNHEDMFVRAAEEYIRANIIGRAAMLHIANGGQVTLESWWSEDAPIQYPSKLKNLQLVYRYHRTDGNEVILSHAGYTPSLDGRIPDEMSLLWDRNHFYDAWPDDTKNTYIVHGHTPIINLRKKLAQFEACKPGNSAPTKPYTGFLSEKALADVDSPLFYCGKHKICIDALTVLSNACFLIDLEDFSFEKIQV